MKKSVRANKINEKHPLIKKKIDKTMNLSIKNGSYSSVALSTGESYLPAFALAMNATASQVGILHAIINLLPNVVQLKASNLLERFTRKELVLSSNMIRILLWIPIILSGVFFALGFQQAIWMLISLTGILYAFLAITQMSWFSWMGSVVPAKKRGAYFSKRNRIMGFWGLIAMIGGALMLDSAKSIGTFYGQTLGFTMFGFGLLFAISMTSRLNSYLLLREQYEPTIHLKKKDHVNLKQFIKTMNKDPFGKFVTYRSTLALFINIASPFWAVYMLRDLGFSYFWLMAITAAGAACQLLFLPLMGKMSDKFGNVRVIKICSGLLFLGPLAWLTSALITNDTILRLYLLIIPSMIAGFAYAGYNLATNNYIYDAVKNNKRGYALSFMNFFTGIGAFIGASIGSIIASINIGFMNALLFIFLISGIGRLIVSTIGLRHLEEVRHVQHYSNEYLIQHFEPMKGIQREIHHLEHLVQKTEHKK